MRLSRMLFTISLALTMSGHAHTQEVKASPGQFDYYLLNLSWAPEFCASEAARHAANLPEMECGSPHGFILHGLWPQNANNTWPAFCSHRPGPEHPEKNLDMTPDLNLLRHEWDKHGTCTALTAETYFATAREAYTAVTIPETFKDLAQPLMLTPDAILATFYQANPAFPQGSFVLSCGNNRLTAIEACFSKDSLKPISCQNVPGCHANNVKITPEITDAIVQ